MRESPKLSIIIVNYNSGEYIAKTVNSILNNPPKNDFEIIVVDNNSTDNSLSLLREAKNLKIIRLQKNIGFGAANNLGAKAAQGKYLLILNNDTVISEHTIDELLNFYENSDYGAVGPAVLYPDGKFQISFGMDLNIFTEFILKYFYELYYRFLYKLKRGKLSREVDWLSGVCFIIKKDIYEEVKGFDEKFFIYLEDCDFFRRLRRKGYKIFYYSDVSIIHYKGKTTGKFYSFVYPFTKKSQLYYYCKYNKKSFKLLKMYLKLKLKIALLFSEKKETLTNTLRVVNEYEC